MQSFLEKGHSSKEISSFLPFPRLALTNSTTQSNGTMSAVDRSATQSPNLTNCYVKFKFIPDHHRPRERRFDSQGKTAAAVAAAADRLFSLSRASENDARSTDGQKAVMLSSPIAQQHKNDTVTHVRSR